MKRPTAVEVLIFVVAYGVAGLVASEAVALLSRSPADSGDRLIAVSVGYLLGAYATYKEPESFHSFASEIKNLFRNKPQNYS